MTILDQLGIWVVGCILGMGIPALLSLQFVPGRQVRGDSLAAMTAEGVVLQTGASIFRFLTLLCGFLVLGPSQLGVVDNFCRRWTDLIWTANRRVRQLGNEKVNYVYYALMTAYALWGIIVLTIVPDRLMIVKVAGIPLNFGLGFSSIHACVVNCTFLPKELGPNWFMRRCLVASAVFFIGIACVAAAGVLHDLGLLR